MEETLLPILRELHQEKHVVWDGSAAFTVPGANLPKGSPRKPPTLGVSQ